MSNAKTHTAQKKALVPELRFKEFDGDWEILKLRDVAKIERGRFSPRPRNNPVYYNGDFPFVQTSDVVNAKGRIENYTQTLNEKGLAVSKLFPAGSILITIAANIGHVGVLKIDMACPDSLIGLICKDNTHNYFLNYYLATHQQKMDYLAPEGAQKNINIEFLKPYKVPFTSLPEQQKIASFLSAVDEKIQQLTKKKALLEQYKKGVMRQLFSQKLRFKPDINDTVAARSGNAVAERSRSYPDWEEKRFGEVCDSIKSGKSKSSDDGKIPLYGSTGIIGKCDEASHQGTFILIARVGANAGTINLVDDDFGVSDNTLILVCKPVLEISYIHYFLNYYNLNRLVFGSGQPLITGGQLKALKFKLPTLGEQQKIASFLSSIDAKIEAVNNQITQTQTFKKGLLQKMFV